MNGTKKTAPGATNTGGGKVETGPTFQTGPHSYSQSTTFTMPGQRVSDYLLPGRENAVPLKRLKELLDLDGRTVRLMIRSERLQRSPRSHQR